MLAQPLDAYLLWDMEPADTLQPGAMESLRGAHCVVAATAFVSEELKSAATILLPIGTFAETSGTYVNLEGRWQSFSGAAQPVGESRPGWKLLRVLGNLLNLEGFEAMSSEDVREALRLVVERNAKPIAAVPGNVTVTFEGPVTVTDLPMYQSDAIVRRAASLQRTREARNPRRVYGEAGA
jgi:NADH-quinone oxidoreductase subunit G